MKIINLKFLVLLFFIFTFSCSKDNTVAASEEIVLARVSASPVAEITGNSASSGATIIDDGNSIIIKKGICWSTSPNPDISDARTVEDSGTFGSSMGNLDFKTVYYVRAYAENFKGISYSDEISFTTTNTCTLNIFDNYVTLTNQTEVAQFGSNEYCGTIYSFIIREEKGEIDPITDLTPLTNLRSVGALVIEGTSRLQNLNGLHNLSMIDDYLSINDNDSLENIDGLNSLSSSFVSIGIRRNNVLQNIDGLSNVTMLVEPDYDSETRIEIGTNPVLQNINGLSNVTIDGDRGAIAIFSNELVLNIDALLGITGEVEFITISNQPNLSNLIGISQITRVSQDVDFSGLDGLSSLAGVENIVSIGNELSIRFNNNLIHLDEFSNLTEVRDIVISRNRSLQDFCGLQEVFNLEGVSGEFNTELNAYNPTRQDMVNGNCSQ